MNTGCRHEISTDVIFSKEIIVPRLRTFLVRTALTPALTITPAQAPAIPKLQVQAGAQIPDDGRAWSKEAILTLVGVCTALCSIFVAY
jgi:hypothetical protein